MVRTPHGDFRPRVNRLRCPSNDEGTEFEAPWFFFRHEIEARHPEAVRTAAHLHTELFPHASTAQQPSLDMISLVRVCTDLESAVQDGSLSFEKIRPVSVRSRGEVAANLGSVLTPHPTPTTPRGSAPPAEQESTWFEVTVLDEQGEPLGGVDLVFAGGGKKEHVTTTPTGTARVEGPGTTKSVQLANVASVTAILKKRWLGWINWDPSRCAPCDHAFQLGSASSANIWNEEPATLVVLAPRDHISVLVIDEDGSPVVGRRYRLTLPTGALLEGETGEDGLIRVEETLSGECNLTLW